MNHLDAIDVGLDAHTPYHEIARKVYLTYPTKAFVGDEERQYEILNEISQFFRIPITCVQVAGSAKTGRSFHKGTDFTLGESDLDVAIIDAGLYIHYTEIVLSAAKGYSDRSGFPIKNGRSTFNEYTEYLAKGLFRPDLMCTGQARAEWMAFFGKLSARHGEIFKSISAAIYLSQAFFENKQRSAVKNYADMKVEK